MSSVTRTYFMLTVTDMPRAVAFYQGVLGPVVRSQSDTWSEIKLGDATVALHLSDRSEPKYTGLGVEVTDLTAAYHAILRLGGQVITGPHTDPAGLLSYEIADSEGNTLTIAGPATAPPATDDPATDDPATDEPATDDPAP